MDDNHYKDARLIWDYHQLSHPIRPCSAAIGLGSYDIGVAHFAVELFQRDMFPVIVFSGATGPFSAARLHGSEAEAFRDEALRLGLPPAAIMTEPHATNTGQNLTLSRRVLTDAGVPVESLMLVCMPYMERRAYATCRKVWPEVEITCASTPVSFDDYLSDAGKGGLPVIDMIVGDLQRIIEYPKRGFAVAQDIPGDVQDAYHRLVSAGYDSRLIAL